jgi:thiamine biosynthesis lipoprotein
MKNLYVFGTIVNIYFKENKQAQDEILKLLYNLDDLCSIYKESSDVSRINKANDYVEVNKIVFDIIKKSQTYSKLTKGDMDITCKPVLDAIKNKKNPQEVLNLVNYKNIILKNPNLIKLKNPNMSLDLGSIVKGYATDMIVEVLKKYNINDAIIDLGGNIYVMGYTNNHQKWKVGIADPINKENPPIGYLELSNMSVVTSGSVQRGNHIINPHTGYPVVNGIKSVSIIAPKSIDAEGLSTAYFVKGLSGLKEINKNKNIGAIYIDENKNIYLSNNLKDKFILLNKNFKIGGN